MARGLRQSPNIFHPSKRSAVGSRNSLAQGERNQEKEVERVVDSQVEKVVRTALHKLPKEALEKLDVMGGVKEKLYNYVNQNFQNMFNRYLTTAEDEMAKKIRDFIDREEIKASNKYNPREMAELLDQIGGPEKFNTGEIEKSTVNMYGHLHGHIQRGINELENETNNLLRQKTDVGAFVRGQNFYSVVKCAFKDDKNKPKTVMNVKLSVNIHDNELISPIFHHQATVEHIVKELIANHIMVKLEKEIEKFNEELLIQGQEEIQGDEQLIKKLQSIPNHTSDEREDPESLRYKYLAKELIERIEGIRAEINPKDYDALNIRENIKKMFDDANIRNRGFNTSINTLTSILDTSKMGYQYCENMKNCRAFVIREYEDIDETQLPDERYSIHMQYLDQAQINALRRSYEKQIYEFEKETELIVKVTDCLVESGKKRGKINDFDDLRRKTYNWRKQNMKEGEVIYEDTTKLWDEMSVIQPDETEVEKQNRSYSHEKSMIKQNLIKCRERLELRYLYQNPKERIEIDKRIIYLIKKFEDFDYKINPNHVQPGLLLETDVVTTKRKRFIMHGMANVLNEFLGIMSKGFTDAAFAAFSRRRSTVREDIDRDFTTDTVETENENFVPNIEGNLKSGEAFDDDAAGENENSGSDSSDDPIINSLGTKMPPIDINGDDDLDEL